MANLVKISEVFLYAGFTESSADTYQAMKLLDSEGIKYTLLTYADPSTHQANFDALNTWNFGTPDAFYKKVFTDFPIVHWTEFYDDWFKATQATQGFQELKDSTLLKNKSLIVT